MRTSQASPNRRRSTRPNPGWEATAPTASSATIGNQALGHLLGRTGRRGGRRPSAGELGSQPDPYVRAVIQSAVGIDLGDVRVHTGPTAQTLLDHIGGDAATLGAHIAMRPQASHASTLPGRVLLLHELTHVAQQTRQQSPTTAGSDLEEHQAHQAAISLATKPPLPLGRATA